jgi:hypothetical protein
MNSWMVGLVVGFLGSRDPERDGDPDDALMLSGTLSFTISTGTSLGDVVSFTISTGTSLGDVVSDGSIDGTTGRMTEGRRLGDAVAASDGDGEGSLVGAGEGLKEGSLVGLTVGGS